MKEIFYIGFLVKKHDVGSQPAASDAKVNVAVVRFRSLVLRVQSFEEQITTCGACACARNRKIIDEEAKHAVVVVICLVNEATWVGW